LEDRVFIRRLGYANPFLSSAPENKVIYSTVQGEGANLQHRGSAAGACVTRLLNRLNACCLSADFLYADMSLNKEQNSDSAGSSGDKTLY
jgi:hypothetical protein